MRDFRGLTVWQKAHELTLSVYNVTSNFPATERYGLTSQLRRGSSSIPTNIAEGCGRHTDRDFARFLVYATGSASEVEYLLLLCNDLGLLNDDVHKPLHTCTIEIKKMLHALRVRLTDC
ncbi:MAG: four helix bundle protein [Myxococcales bacterium]|nr:four helix bundle protein [Myxococcales bacterium]